MNSTQTTILQIYRFRKAEAIEQGAEKQEANRLAVVECQDYFREKDCRMTFYEVEDFISRAMLAEQVQKQTAQSCDGSCSEHAGKVKLVHVTTKNGFDWGKFYYCDSAIAEDKQRGLIVELVIHSITTPAGVRPAETIGE